MTDTTKHIAVLRGQLANLAGMKSSAKQAEKNIQTSAGNRMAVLEADIKVAVVGLSEHLANNDNRMQMVS